MDSKKELQLRISKLEDALQVAMAMPEQLQLSLY
jgi:hypothetical protein